MKIPIKEFEQCIDEIILKRGFQYFKKGLVSYVEEISFGEYEAKVCGTDDYFVNINIKNDVITEYVCTCPYDFGPVCKHVVAVIFHLQQDELGLKAISQKEKKSATKRTSKKKTVAEQMDEILMKVPQEKLKDYIKEYCSNNSAFRQLFMADFAYLVMEESKVMYAKKVKAVLKRFTRNGFIEYKVAKQLEFGVKELLKSAEKHIESGNNQTAFYIATAVLEETYKAFLNADDSSGLLGSCIDSSINIFNDIAQNNLSEKLRIDLLNYCLTLYERKLFSGWDWQYDLISVAIEVAKTEDEASKIFQVLKHNEPDLNAIFYETSMIKQLQLIRKFEDEETMKLFVEGNLNVSEFRRIAIGTAIDSMDYEKAIKLSEEGVQKDSKDKPGLATEWNHCLLKIYIKQGNIENIIKYAHFLFINSKREIKQYFYILKQCIKPENWNNYVNQLIEDIKTNSRWTNYHAIAEVYIWEENWDQLLEIVKQNISLGFLDNYEEYLIKDYKSEIIDLYQKSLNKYVETNIGRNYYQTACSYLRKMIKMDAVDTVNEMIVHFKAIYPGRKALMEELAKV